MIMVPAEAHRYIETIIYIHSEYLHVLANYVAIFRDVNYKMYLVYGITINTINNWLQFTLQRHVSTHTSHHQVMFRTFERIRRLCAFWDPKKLTLFTPLTYNYYLKVLWLCVFNAVPIFECFPDSLLLLNVLLFLASSFCSGGC